MSTKRTRQVTAAESAAPEFDDQAVEPNLEITHPFDPAKIKVATIPALIDGIIKRIDHQEIDLEPSFQRRARLWDNGRKSRLIESLLLRIPLPLFYVAADSKDNWKVVDGIQRLTTIHDFVKGAFTLAGLEYLTQLVGLPYAELPRPMQRRIEETQLMVNVIQDGTPEDVTFNIFKRINTGGVELTQQEIRNALYSDDVRQFLRELASSEEFLVATDYSVNDERMGAQEMILRYLAFRLTPWQTYVDHNPGLDSFLGEAMQSLSQMTSAKRKKMGKEFKRAMQLAHVLFGDNAFRKSPNDNDKRKPVNRPLFEVWSVSLAELTEEQKNEIELRKRKLLTAFNRLNSNMQFSSSISFSTTNVDNIRYRFEKVQQLIEKVLQ